MISLYAAIGMRIPITLTQAAQATLSKILDATTLANRGQVLSKAVEAGLHTVHQDERAHRGCQVSVYVERIAELEAFAAKHGLPTLERGLAAYRGEQPAAAQRDLAILEQAHAARNVVAPDVASAQQAIDTVLAALTADEPAPVELDGNPFDAL